MIRLINCRWVEVHLQPSSPRLNPIRIHLHRRAIRHTWKHYKWTCGITVGLGFPALIAIPTIVHAWWPEVSQQWGGGIPTGGGIIEAPEPGALSLLSTALVIFLIIRKLRRN